MLLQEILKREDVSEDVKEEIQKYISERRESEKVLQYYAGLVQNIKDPIISTDLDFNVRSWNESAELVYGWSAEEVIGKPLVEFIWQKSGYDNRNEIIEDLFKKGYWQGEVIHYRKDGVPINILTSVALILDDKKKPIGAVSVNRDITKRKQNEEALRETTEYLENLFRYANAPVIVWDTDGKIIRFNPAFEALTGYHADEIICKTLEILFPPEKIKDSIELIQMAQAGKRWESVEIEIITRDGTTRTVLWNSAVVWSTDGKTAVATIAQGQDITQRKNVEEALRLSEIELKEAQSIALLGRWELNLLNNNLQWSETIFKIFEIDQLKFEASYKLFIETIHPDDRELVNKSFIESISNLQPYNIVHRLLMPDGRIKWVNEIGKTYGDQKGVAIRAVGVVQDITERKEAEEQLNKLSIAIEQSPVSILITDSKGNIEYANPRFSKLTGFRIEEVKGNNPKILQSGKTDVKVYIDLWKTIRSGNIWKGEFINKKKNGEEFIEEATIAPVFSQNKTIISYIAIKEDITIQKKLEQELKESEEKYRLIAENASDVIWIANIVRKRFVYVSPSVLKINGFTPEEAMEQDIFLFVTPEYELSVMNLVNDRMKIFEEGKEKDNVYIDQFQQRCKNGDYIWTETSSTYRYDQSGEIEILGISRNIENRKKLEAEILAKNQKLAELNATKDKFFSIIAHDLRNPFTGILGSTELLINNLNDYKPEKVEKYIRYIDQAANSAYKLLENLLTWSRSQTGKISFHPERFLLEELFFETISVSKGFAMHKNISLNYELNEVIEVYADKNMINTVLRNLINNAIKFTPRSGKVILKAEQNENEIIISVEDTGVGISPEKIDKLFGIGDKTSTPGTEKEKGTGLGLVICKDFILRHGGNIYAKSKPGKGSRFIITLPKPINTDNDYRKTRLTII